MPRYYFTVHGPDGDQDDRDGLTLPNLQAAIAYAEDAILERRHDIDSCRATVMLVMDERRRPILSLPFLPGCG
jgi:Domain of unknown function (DUF6894)